LGKGWLLNPQTGGHLSKKGRFQRRTRKKILVSFFPEPSRIREVLTCSEILLQRQRKEKDRQGKDPVWRTEGGKERKRKGKKNGRGRRKGIRFQTAFRANRRGNTCHPCWIRLLVKDERERRGGWEREGCSGSRVDFFGRGKRPTQTSINTKDCLRSPCHKKQT